MNLSNGKPVFYIKSTGNPTTQTSLFNFALVAADAASPAFFPHQSSPLPPAVVPKFNETHYIGFAKRLSSLKLAFSLTTTTFCVDKAAITQYILYPLQEAQLIRNVFAEESFRISETFDRKVETPVGFSQNRSRRSEPDRNY